MSTWLDLRTELYQRRIDFLKADLAVSFTFVNVAATELNIGNLEAAAKAIGHAEKAYETIRHFLTDSKHVSHLTANEVRDFKAELQRLREKLDQFQRGTVINRPVQASRGSRVQ